MANNFSKEERVAFENLLEGFQDAEVLARAAVIFNSDSTEMERSNNIIWRPQPYILPSYTGSDQSANFQDAAQLAVPAQLGFRKAVPWALTDTELRDALQEGRLGDAAKQRLASDINVALLGAATNLGSLVVKRTVAATGFDDVALCDSIMNEQGVPSYDRYIALSSRDYNNMASNLGARGTVQGKVQTAYEKAYIGNVSGFDAFKLDYSLRLAAAGGSSITMDTRDSGANYWTPKSFAVSTSGETSNVDNRFQTITVSSTTSMAAGDAFTIAAVNAVHHITKQDTGQLKTFRVVSVPSSTTLVITPPIISNQVSTPSGTQYQNCVVNTKASNSALVFLNTVSAAANVFWQKDALELLPGRIAAQPDAGMNVMRGKTDSGIEVVMQKQADIKTGKILYRLDTLFGVVNKQPEMSGIILFSQT
jgi:hypothetical protein